MREKCSAVSVGRRTRLQPAPLGELLHPVPVAGRRHEDRAGLGGNNLDEVDELALRC